MFVHLTNGVYFIAPNKNFVGGIFVVFPQGKEFKYVAQAIGASTAFHAMHIWPTLNGFAGYDACQYHMITTSEPMFLLDQNEIIREDDFWLMNECLIPVPFDCISRKVSDIGIVFRNVLSKV